MDDLCERASCSGWPELGGEVAGKEPTEEDEEDEWCWRVKLLHASRKASCTRVISPSLVHFR
jgi:hypothetical protein